MQRQRASAGPGGPAPGRGARIAPALVILAMIATMTMVALAGSCVDDRTTLCHTGLRCPAGLACTQDGSGCTATSCGNGKQEGDEVCDDGNLRPGDGCNVDCTSTEECGNGVQDIGEQCDHGPDENLPPCDSECQFRCGNQRLDVDEECDGSRFAATCLDFGFDRGALSCASRTCVVQTDGCSHIGWHRDLRLAEDISAAGIGNLYGVWGEENGQMYAVGESASGELVMILHFNGQRWDVQKSGPNKGTLLDVWGSSIDDAFAVGEGGRAFYKQRDSAWMPLNTGLTEEVALRGVWGAGPDGDVIAVGDGARIIRFNRSSLRWNTVPLTGVAPDTVFEAVWGRAQDEIYAVGHGGMILRHDGVEWVQEAAGLTGADLLDVWGTAEGEVFAVGAGGTILHRDQDGWSLMSNPHPGDLHGLWGSGGDSVFAVGERGTVLFYDGRSWMALATDTDLRLTDVWSVPGYGLAAVAPNGFILRLDGWSWMPLPVQQSDDTMRSLWVDASDDSYALFAEAPYVRHFDGSAWSDVSERFPELGTLVAPAADGTSPLRNLWGGAGGELYAVGDGNLVLRYRPGQGWERLALDASIPASRLHQGWSSDDGHLFVVGELEERVGSIILRHDGVSWRQMSRDSTAALHGIWGAARNDVFAVGAGGTILHYDGIVDNPSQPEPDFTRMNSGTTETLRAIWGSSREDVHVVGDNGVALSFNGTVWSLFKDIAPEHLRDVWGSGDAHVFAVGSGGTLFHRQKPDRWAVVSSGTDQQLTTIDGFEGARGNYRVVVFGGEGAAFRRLLVHDDAVAVY